MARKKAISPFKKFVIVVVVLIAFEAAYLALNWPKAPLEDDRRIQKTAEGVKGVDQSRKDQLKIQLAVVDYRAANDGKLPKSLSELVPKYFPAVPVDPSTGKAFEYRVDGNKFYVGSSSPQSAAGDESTNKGKAEAAQPVMSQNEQTALLSVIDEKPGQRTFIYSPAGKKDPFLPFDVSPDLESDSDKSPLERYDIKNWRMTAVINSADGLAAVVEGPSGRGYTVKKGTKIGLRSGEIVEITPDKVVVVESEIDFTGEEKRQVSEIPMQALQNKGAEEQAQ